MKLIDLLNSVEVKELGQAVELLGQIVIELKGIRMDTSALKTALSTFAVDFTKFAGDLATFVSTNVPQDTPQQIADVKAATDGLVAFDQQVKALDALLNPVPADNGGGTPPPPPPPPPPPVG